MSEEARGSDFRERLKQLEGGKVTVALDLSWTWKERQIEGTLLHIGRDYVAMEESFDGRRYDIPFAQILYVTTTS